jgi:hypothetical protein
MNSSLEVAVGVCAPTGDAATPRHQVAGKPGWARWRVRIVHVPLLLAVAACTDNAFYVRSDAAAGLPAELIGLDPALLAVYPLQVVTTFKSDGVVMTEASDTLYDSIAAGLRSRGIHDLRHYGLPGTDVGLDIAALQLAAKAAAAPKQGEAPPAVPRAPRLMVLVENHPDLSTATRAEYFASGFTLGTWSLNKPTDRYEITIAYRDPQGQAHIYHSHQDMIFSTGSSVTGRDDAAVARLRRYDDPLAAFGGVVANSINGGPGVITVGKPQSAAAASSP